MTNAITEARNDVAAALADIQGLQVWTYVPEKLQAPAAVITADEPYVVPGQVLGELQVGFAIRLFTSGTNEVVTQALDALIANVCVVLEDFGPYRVAKPGVDDASYDARYLVTDIAITTNYSKGA